ncbi:MAG: hypothetical protein GYB37_06420 [Algicola sp.]|nr:hypothetical protein [Algicola sp.]
MDKQEDKKLEALIDKFMEEVPMESPSVDFTQNVLQKLKDEAPKEVFKYKPILSGRTLFFGFIAFVALLVFTGSQLGLDSDQGWFKNIKMDAWFQMDWRWMGGFSSSKTMVYAFLFLGLLFFVQVPWLKKQLDSKVF